MQPLDYYAGALLTEPSRPAVGWGGGGFLICQYLCLGFQSEDIQPKTALNQGSHLILQLILQIKHNLKQTLTYNLEEN